MHISVKLGGSCAEKILKVYCSKLPVANTRPTCGYFLLYDKLWKQWNVLYILIHDDIFNLWYLIFIKWKC